MGGNIIATAGNNINILAETLDNSYSRKEKSSGFSSNFSASGGGLTAGVSYNKSSLEQQSNGTTIAVSTLMSEGSTVLDAGNRIKTEAMQANVGEDLIIRGVNGVDLLDAKETYEDKMKQKSSSIGITANFAFTPAQIVSTVNDVVGNVKDYGFENSSQTINTIGNGIQDIRNVTSLTGNLYEGIKAGSQYLNGVNSGLNKDVLSNAKQDALSNLISADISLSYNQSSSQSNTRGTTSVAGVINVGGNMIVESEGDVRFVNQKITVGENVIINAKNFEALAGENTYTNTTKSNSAGVSAGYDIVNNVGIGGVNVSAGNSNTTSKTYDNTTINAGGTFQLTTTEDATFKGANVTADKINFDIGKNLNIISLQDEYKSHGESAGVGINVSGQIPGTTVERGYALPSFGGNYSQDNADSKWVSDQTSIIANNGGSIKVNETLTNIGAIVGSLSEDNKLSIDAKKLVTEDLKDYNKGENYGIDVSGIGKDTLVPQTGVQYGSHDKEQNTNATFANTEITENGVKLDLEKLGINTDITKAQVVTKDEVVEQIDTVIHTDLINTTTRNQVMEDILKTGALVPEIAQGIKEGLNNPGETVLGQISNNMAERSDDIKAFVEGRDKKLEKELEKYKDEEGKIRIDDDEAQKILADSFRKTLDEFGKGNYDIVFVVGDPKYPVSIDDEHGVMYVNIAGYGFGNPEEMRKNVQHDGGHGTYHDRGIDETAADRLGNKDKVLTPSNAVIDADIIEKLKSGTEAYNKARENGDIQDKTTIGGEVSKNKANIIGKQIPEEKKGVVYTFDMIEKTINSTFSTDININRDKYNSDPNYRDKINYYYFQAENHLKDSTVLATGTSNGITQIAVKTKDGKTVSLSEIPQTEAVFHNIHYNKDGTFYIEYNSSSVYRKFVSEDGHELIMSKDLKTVIKDPTVYGTYNYYTYGSDIGGTYDKVQHLTDINLWKEYGSGPDDWTTKAQRLKANTLAEKLSNAPIVSDKNFKDWLVKNNITKVTEKTFEQYKNRK